MVTPLLLNLVATRFVLQRSTSSQKSTGIKHPPKHRTTSAVGVFFHHRDVKVALEELAEINFPLNKVSIIARDGKQYNWNDDRLKICSRFNANLLELPESLRYLLHHYFNRRRYLVLVSGVETEIKIASKILSRRPKHCEVWQW